MKIAEQFAGLQMDQLIGGPLRAAADANAHMANSTADFINKIGFDNKGNVRNVMFGYQKRTANEDGTSNLDELKVAVPILAIVPIPNLQVDEVNILFDMEVKQSQREEETMDMSASMDASLKIWPVKVNVTGSVSSHQSNTRSSDNSAKYHVDVRATNHGIPEGLARVLDMMAANVAPSLVSSTLKDGNGQDLSEQARIKAERLKLLRQEIRQIEERLMAAKDGFTANLTQLKKVASVQLNTYKEAMTRKMNSFGAVNYDKEISAAAEKGETQKVAELEEKKAAEEKQVTEYSDAMAEVNQAWSNFQSQAGELVKLIADSENITDGVSEIFALKALNGELKVAPYASGESQYSAMTAAQKVAVDGQRNVSRLESELINKKAEYSDAIAGKAPAITAKSGGSSGGTSSGGGAAKGAAKGN
ncbi:MAG: DUF2589 domain-containing protein [Lachnospiraceae bacterium]|nr:DUF2589 domain-containing protein [Lachnospiraceae bacterium]